MSPDRKPWLYMKRLDSWNPLAAVRPMLRPEAEASEETPDSRPRSDHGGKP